MEFPMILASVEDKSLRARQQVSQQQIERLLKRTLRGAGYTFSNNLEAKDYILNLYNRKNRNLDEKALGFLVKKGEQVYWVFYRYNGIIAIFQKEYLENCMAEKHPAPFFRKFSEE